MAKNSHTIYNMIYSPAEVYSWTWCFFLSLSDQFATMTQPAVCSWFVTYTEIELRRGEICSAQLHPFAKFRAAWVDVLDL